MEKRYVVVDRGRDCDRDVYIYATAEEANAEAKRLWNHLTDREKKHRNIYAGVVTSDMLDPDDVEDYSEDAWGMTSDVDSFPCAFDSSEVTTDED